MRTCGNGHLPSPSMGSLYDGIDGLQALAERIMGLSSLYPEIDACDVTEKAKKAILLLVCIHEYAMQLDHRIEALLEAFPPMGRGGETQPIP